MSYHGIQVSRIALILYGLFAIAAGGAVRDTGQLAGGIGLLVVLAGAFLDPILEKRIATATN